MAYFGEEDKQHFPLKNIDGLLRFIESHLQTQTEPNLALISIVLGCIENSLTCPRKLNQRENENVGKQNSSIPTLELSKVEALYQRFVSFVKGSIDSTHEAGPFTSRESVKRISDVIWSGLTSNYTDKAHLQSLYSYLTGNKLDCFGVALGVVAACQILGYNDVHLSLSEDHAWVSFGESGKETAEVTWHGKGVEDKRGQPIDFNGAGSSWLYLDGQAVICSRHTELAAIISSINPAINASSDSMEMMQIQQQLLWLMFDLGHLDRYPMALGTLGDLEEISPTPNRPICEDIYKQGVSISRRFYRNHHVYPHTYIGAFYFRQGRYKQALKHWAEAAEVISQYNYSRDDEEIYKEFLEIAHDSIPQIVKLASDGYLVGSNYCTLAKSPSGRGGTENNLLPFLKDRENYELILRFYDGICEWEEGSKTPVLHITWAKHFIFSLSKFDGTMRNNIEVVRDPGDESSSASESESDSDSEVDRDEEDDTRKRKQPEVKRKCAETNSYKKTAITNQTIDESQSNLTKVENFSSGNNNNDIRINHKKGDIIKSPATLALTIDTEEDSVADQSDSNIADLAKACADSILNPDFLLGKGEPFTTSTSTTMFTTISQAKSQLFDLKEDAARNGSSKGAVQPLLSTFTDKIPSLISISQNDYRPRLSSHSDPFMHSPNFPKLQFRSAKMKGLKGLLTSERLNTSAINLQMTAQSQVSLKHSKVSSTYDQAVPRKRTRRSEPM